MKNKNIYLLLILLILFSFCKKKINFVEVIPPKENTDLVKQKDNRQKDEIQNQQEAIISETGKIKPENQKKEGHIVNNSKKEEPIYQTGIASWYGGYFHGRDTASGEVYDKNEISAAHKTLPFGTIVKVKNLENGRELTLKINDRGPFVKGRIIDLSEEAAKQLGFRNKGTAKVSISIIKSPKPIKYRKRNHNLVYKKRAPDLQQTAYFYIQAGAFKIKQNALSTINKLNNLIPSANFHIIFSKNLNIVVSDTTKSFGEIIKYTKILKQKNIDYIVRKTFKSDTIEKNER